MSQIPAASTGPGQIPVTLAGSTEPRELDLTLLCRQVRKAQTI
jgi:hypothetical protein